LFDINQPEMSVAAIGGRIRNLHEYALRVGREPGLADSAGVTQIFIGGKA
jgi:hypothetical protein